MKPPAIIATLLEMAAVNNGFDRELTPPEGWRAFASTQAPLRIWLRIDEESRCLVALSQLQVHRALSDHREAMPAIHPEGAVGVRAVTDFSALHTLLRRAFQLSRTLPDELLHVFQQQVAGLPRTTEVERLVIQRIGQDLFRAGLMDYWEGRCAVTGLAVPELLRASHIKPWADCAADAERLDVFNGLLLAVHLDAAFDRGFVTFPDDGALVIGPELGPMEREILGLTADARLAEVAEAHWPYLRWHREQVFRRPAMNPSGGG